MVMQLNCRHAVSAPLGRAGARTPHGPRQQRLLAR